MKHNGKQRPIEGVRRLRLEKGDVLVMTCPGHMTETQRVRLRAEWGRLFPDVRCVIMEDGCDVKVVRKADAEPPTDAGGGNGRPGSGKCD